MSSPFHERGEFVPVKQPGVPAGPAGAWPVHQPWYGPMYGPMPPVTDQVVPVPPAVRAASWLWLAASLLYLTGWLVAAFVDVPFVAADIYDDPDGGTMADARGAAIVLFVFAVAAAAVFGVVQSVFGFLLGRRQNWARVLLTVLGGLMLLVLPADVAVGAAWRDGAPTSAGDPWEGFVVVAVLAAVQFGVTIAAIVSMYLRGSNHFFSGGRRG